MNCRGCQQRFLPLPDLSRKIEGDSVRRVRDCQNLFAITRFRYIEVRYIKVLLYTL